MSGTTSAWFAVVDSSGNLVSTGTSIADDATLAANGYSKIPLSGNPAGQVWNATSKTFGSAPPPPTVLSTWQFIQRFTPAEFAAIEASTDQQVRMFLLMLQTAPMVTLQDQVVQTGLQYLVAQNLLTSARAATIGAP